MKNLVFSIRYLVNNQTAVANFWIWILNISEASENPSAYTYYPMLTSNHKYFKPHELRRKV